MVRPLIENQLNTKNYGVHILDTYNKLNLVDPFNAFRISIVKVQAHSGCSGNEAADKGSC